MTKRFSFNVGAGLRFVSWSTALIGIVVIKGVLSLALKPGSFLVSYSGISYFLLLLLAISFAVRNVAQDTSGARPFWLFLAIGYGLWAFDQWLYLYYELRLHTEVPDNSIADTILFLHIVPFIAAVATLPHQRAPERSFYRPILNFLFLLFFWAFLYAYCVFPHQYLYSTSSYARRFDVLYLIENLTLLVAVGILTLRANAPWKSIYLHLLGASTLYTLSSTVANLAIDSGGYVNGKLYGLGLTASVCWFVWVPLGGRLVTRPDVGGSRFEGSQNTHGSAWTMLVVVLISIPIVCELFRRSEYPGLRTLRLLIAIAAILCLASAAYAKEYLTRRELAFQINVVNDRLRSAMQTGTWIGWDLDVKSGRAIWFGDLQTIFGVLSEKYAGSLQEFIGYVHPDDRERVLEALTAAPMNGRSYAQEFRVLSPDGAIRWLAARGKVYSSRNRDPERMVTVALDITERKLTEEKLREYEKAVEGAEELIAVVDRDHKFLIANRQFLRVRNMTREQVVGHYAHEVLNKEVFEAVIKEKLEECFRGKVVRYEMKYTYPELGERDVLVSYFPIEGPAGVDRAASIVQDVTDRKELERALAGMSRKLIEAQENERARIARDLHDDINQRLALLVTEVEQIQQSLPPVSFEIRDQMLKLQRSVRQLSADVYSMAYELHYRNLEYVGLAAALRTFCSEFSARQEVEVSFESDDIRFPVPQEVSVCLFRILQESLHNAARHSKVRHFAVRLGLSTTQLYLSVLDHGIGFDPATAMTNGGLGLISMRERVRLVNGTLTIESKPMGGTTIQVRVPYESESSSRSAAG